MALEAAFKKQLSKQKCIVCGEMVPYGIYSRHLNSCLSDPNDEECKVIRFLTPEDKRRIAIENTITLDDPNSLVNDCCASSTKNLCSDASSVDVNSTYDAKPAADVRTQTSKTKTTSISISEGLCDSVPSAKESYAESCCPFQKNNLNTVGASGLIGKKRTAQITLESSAENREKKQLTEKSCELLCSSQRSEEVIVKQEEDAFHRSVKKECSSPAKTIKVEPQTLLPVNILLFWVDEKGAERAESLEEVADGLCNYFRTCNCVIGRRQGVMTEMTDDSEANEGRFSSPYYLVLFNYICKKVFETNGDLLKKQQIISFWGDELRFLQKFMLLSTPSKQLLIRLFLRRRNWLSVERLKYDNIAPDLTPLFEEMAASGFVETCQKYAFELEDALRLLEAPSIKNVAKKFKLDYTLSKEELTQKLLNLSKQKNVFGLPMCGQILKIVKTEMGARYRINHNVLKFMMSVFTLFSPIDMDSSALLDQPTVNLASQLLFVILQLHLEKIRFPAPAAPDLLNIYSNRSLLYGYVEAKLVESEMAYLMQKGAWEEVRHLAEESVDAFAECYSRNRTLLDQLPPYLRRFTDCWVYVRCISHGVEAYQRLRQYDDAVQLLRHLLFEQEYKIFLTSARGSWWDRLALNLDSHLKNKAESFEAVKAGIGDSALGEKDILLLQLRGEKLNKMWKGPLDVPLPHRIDITGVTLGKAIGDQRINHFTTQRNGQCYECPVEEVALDYYIKNEGFKEGVHAEGSIWHFVYGLLCYDIIFDHSVDNVWFSETQTNPADLNSKWFYLKRKEKFDDRFMQIENSRVKDLIEQIIPTYEEHYGETNSEIAWECFTGLDQIKRFMLCCKPRMLTAVFRRITTDYRNCRSGFPDLTVWNNSTKKLAVVEVKGPGDKLSSKQILWLHYFKQQDVRAEVCHVAASNPKLIV